MEARPAAHAEPPPLFLPRHSRMSVFEALIKARLKRGAGFTILEDQDRKPLTYGDLLRAAFALGGKLKAMTRPGERVGVLLPSSAGAAVTFFALLAVGRVPAMLNFTAGALNLKAALDVADVKIVLTSARFLEQANLQGLADALSQEAKIVRLEDVRATIGIADKLAAVTAAMAPGAFAHSAKPDDEAVVLFTSGSFGAPRGVVLSQANLVSNVHQINAHIAFEPDWIFFSPLPVFHSFGLTGGLLLPVLTGHKVFVYPSPLHFKIIPKLVKETGANVLLATDTFAYQYARAGDGEDLKGLKFIVCGAERVRNETRDLFEKKLGVLLIEGYGATEAAPVIAVNKPSANAPGTVGTLLPGIETRLEKVPGINEGANLFVRGPNVMSGYLNADGLAPPVDGWHDTGDVVVIDEDGRITIKGRTKRFAKIGGEMVSLAAVEGYAAAVWPEHRHAAISAPDPRKGERIILITDRPDAVSSALLDWAQANGAPEIAIPRKVIAVAEVPVLGTGKTDYVAVKALALAEINARAA
jgi:acyl-[acyl-carrier-protein]-phospholipid O-acyltransferase / long-chain-fatty-acid--[acyl-carrier-protein] ligase